MDPKLLAKKHALMGMSSKIKDDTRMPLKDGLAEKKKIKLVIEAPDKAGLVKGLSKAEEILKKKFGELGLSEDSMDDMDEMSGEGCPICGESIEDMHEHEEAPEGEELEMPEEELELE
jgi:hypothetical protein